MFLRTHLVVKRELRRIELTTGNRVDDWLYDCAENAESDWRYLDDDGNECYDVEAIEEAIVNDADNYLDFIDKHYPEELHKAVE